MFNDVKLHGRLTATPELRTTNSDKKVVSFRLAVDRDGKNAGTDFINVVAWDSTAEFIAQHFEKGQQILVSARLRTHAIPDKNDSSKSRTVMDVVADRVYFCGNKPAGAGNAPAEVAEETLEDIIDETI